MLPVIDMAEDELTDLDDRATDDLASRKEAIGLVAEPVVAAQAASVVIGTCAFCSVCGLIWSLRAAPNGPSMRPWHAASARSM